VLELPYTGINRIRFEGSLSARQGHPQLDPHGSEWTRHLQEKEFEKK
jgi:hypothetical protein